MSDDLVPEFSPVLNFEKETSVSQNPNTTLEFFADRVKVKTGHKQDNSGEVTFEVGEYMLKTIKELAAVTDKMMKVTVEIA